MPKMSVHQYSVGGHLAHLFRRIIHVMTLFFLWVYYYFHLPISVVWGILAVVICLELLRLIFGWTVYGQRGYEKRQISAFAWAVIAISLVLVFAPGKQFAIPIISAYALGDPLLGELRRTRLHKILIIAIGCVAITSIWFLANICWPTPWWLWIVMGPITVAAEWPCLKWIDDNALMQLVPLLVVLILPA